MQFSWIFKKAGKAARERPSVRSTRCHSIEGLRVNEAIWRDVVSGLISMVQDEEEGGRPDLRIAIGRPTPETRRDAHVFIERCNATTTQFMCS